MDAALHAHLGCTAFMGLLDPACHFFQRKIVRCATQRGMAPTFGEGAKTAFIGAEVGVIDVAIDDVPDRSADRVAPQAIRDLPDGGIVRTTRREQVRDLLRTEPATRHGVFQCRTHGTIDGAEHRKTRRIVRRGQHPGRPISGVRITGGVHGAQQRGS